MVKMDMQTEKTSQQNLYTAAKVLLVEPPVTGELPYSQWTEELSEWLQWRYRVQQGFTNCISWEAVNEIILQCSHAWIYVDPASPLSIPVLLCITNGKTRHIVLW